MTKNKGGPKDGFYEKDKKNLIRQPRVYSLYLVNSYDGSQSSGNQGNHVEIVSDLNSK